jgi:transcriptional regulator with XRE-family HTH domain
MSKVDETPRTVPLGSRKAARLLREARRRSGLSQTELAKGAGFPIQTVHRIEHAQVDPRLGTLERLLATCGRTLGVEDRPGMDRSEIRELLGLSPIGRLGWGMPQGWALRAARTLRMLRGRGVRFVVVGAAAQRIHGAPVPIDELTIRVRDKGGLRRALRAVDGRFVRVGLTVILMGSLRAATPVQLCGGLVDVESLEELIEESTADRAELLRCVQEEIDAR